MKLESILQYMDELLDIAEHPDYSGAMNGLQVAGPEEIELVAAAVDASQATIDDAVGRGADLLLVHHGLFWDGRRPITGRRYRRVRALLDGGTALYAAHLPLDGHPEVGNCALLARALELEPADRFGSYEGRPIGWACPAELDRDELVGRAEAVLGREVRLIPGGPELCSRVAVLTGGGGSFIEEAARSGCDTLVTGEGAHHTYFDAVELGVNVLYGGHYATETFGVRALAEAVAERFDLEWLFLDHPTGL